MLGREAVLDQGGEGGQLRTTRGHGGCGGLKGWGWMVGLRDRVCHRAVSLPDQMWAWAHAGGHSGALVERALGLGVCMGEGRRRGQTGTGALQESVYRRKLDRNGEK